MTRFLVILRAVLEMHAWADRHEPALEWEMRADTLSDAIVAEARSDADAAALLAILKGESRALRSVHAGTAHSRYRGPWQLARCSVADDGEWQMLAGLDLESTQYSAEVALRVYRQKLGICNGNVACAMSKYSGSHRITKQGRDRARWAREYLRRLEQGKEVS